jgi:hypothetical protein
MERTTHRAAPPSNVSILKATVQKLTVAVSATVRGEPTV